MKRMIILFLLLSVLLTVQGQDKLEDILVAGPVTEKSPPAKWGTSCYDSEEKMAYWFGGSGGASKNGPLLMYAFQNGQWSELTFKNKNEKLFEELRFIEKKLKGFYSLLANRYYQSELEEERKIDFQKELTEIFEKMDLVSSSITSDKISALLQALKADLKTLKEKINSTYSAKEVGKAREIYRNFVIVANSFDTQPSPRFYTSMAFDEKTKKIILFGGEGILGVYADTWVFDIKNKTWEQTFPELSPAPRCGHGMVAKNGQVYLVGGFNARGSLSYCTGLWNRLPIDVWRYDIEKSTWQQIQKPDGKPASVSMQPAYKISILDDNLLYSGDKISYGKKVGEVKGELKLTSPEIETDTFGVTPFTIQVRESGFDPAWYENVEEPNVNSFQEFLKNIPVNTWVNVSPPVRHVNRDWGTTVLDLKRDQLLHWAGGHSSHCGTDVAHYSLSLNRWHIAYTPELPFESVYSNDGARVPSLSGSPWASHTYLSYAIDSQTNKMIWAGKHSAYSITNPSMAFLYDPSTYEWASYGMQFEKDTFDVERHKTCMVPTPHGILC